ncbi:MAG: type II toxin-antitoxin system PemK/MazF family toxin [Candidatus Cloacimonetes bacterium]|nr:type II toxin-antitoxin system PemK/MazF family toxin [Candidatus Cloacimonadota bacterium]
MYNQREIVLVPIPFTDLSNKKRRPVVIVSNDNYNQLNQDLVVVAITSNIVYDNEYCLEISDNNLESGNLPLVSKIKCDKIYTISQNIIVKKFSKINAKTFIEINKKVNRLIRSRKN